MVVVVASLPVVLVTDRVDAMDELPASLLVPAKTAL
jgi:hypothetical protein